MSAVCAPTYRWTVDEYEELGRLGVFGDSKRLELLSGEIIVMSPIGYRHNAAVMRLTKFFVRNSDDRFEVGPQTSFNLDDHSQPQPDVILLAPGSDTFGRLPTAAETFLVIEVSDSTVKYDREDKAPAYAAQGIPEFWLLNLEENCLEIFRNPQPAGYGEQVRFEASAEVCPLAFPDLKIRVGKFLP